MHYVVSPPAANRCFCSIIIIIAALISTSFSKDIGEFEAEIRPLLKEYCFSCHGEEKQKGELRLDELGHQITTLDQLERWVDVADQLKAGEMPPAKADNQPSPEEFAQIIEWVTRNNRLAGTALNPPQRLGIRRMTREQYNATMQDLLGLPLNFVGELPEEGLSEAGFSNDAELLNLSPLHIEFFLQKAESAIAKTVVSGVQPEGGHHFKLEMAPLAQAIKEDQLSHSWPIYSDGVVRLGKPPKGEKWPPVAATYREFSIKAHPNAKKRPDLIVFDKDGMQRAPHVKLHYSQLKSKWGNLVLPGDKDRGIFATEGWLRVRIRAGSEIPEGAEPPGIQVMLNYDVLHGKTLNDLGTRKVTAPLGKPDTYDFIVRLENLNLPSQNNEKGPPFFEIWNPRWLPSSGDKPCHEVADELGLAKVYIESVQVDWPWIPNWPPDQHTAIVGDGQPTVEQEMQSAQGIISRFMRRAHRGPVDDLQMEPIVDIFKEERNSGRDFLESIRTSLATVLCSPGFLYIDQSVENGKLTQHAVASRLSYLLWNSMPDQRLLELAESGGMHDRKVLLEEAERMLGDAKSTRFIEQFASEWLEMSALENVAVNQEIHRGFDFSTKDLLRKETISFVAEVINRDLSVFNFIDSDFMMLNNQLARHYEVQGVWDNSFHPVPAAENRGGLLTHGSILIATGTGEESHPFKRGVFVLDKILGTPPPEPPATAPQLPTSDPDFGKKTLAEQLEVHRQQAACASCHRKLDPWGLALENFDAIGQWRNSYKTGNKSAVASAVSLPNGTEIEGINGLKRVILEAKRELFLRNLIKRLLTYTKARSLDATDEADIDEMVQLLKNNDYKMRSLILELVGHPSFLTP